MNLPWPWRVMKLEQAASVREVRRRYSELLKLNRPEDNPLGFQQLREAYEICLDHAREREAADETPGDGGPIAETAAPLPQDELPHPASATPRDSAPHAAEPGDAARVDTITPPRIAAVEAASPHPPAVRADDPSPSPLPSTSPVHVLGEEPRPLAARPPGMRDDTPSVAPPTLRAPDVVVDALLQVDAQTPPDDDAFARWFNDCAEFASFVSRDRVELELLWRITGGARPSLRALRIFGGAFGWRQVGFERRLQQLGVPPHRAHEIDDALFRAGAEAQFAHHVAARERLIPQGQESLGLDGEIALLQRLRAQREVRPRFFATLSSSRLNQINAVLRHYAERYGNAAVLHLFGADTVAYWRRAYPGSEPNRLQVLSSTARALIVVGWFAVGLVIIGLTAALAGRQPLAERAAELGRIVGGVLLFGLIGALIVNGWRFALFALHRAYARFDSGHEAWMQRRILPWLGPPRRGLPVMALSGLALAALAHFAGLLPALSGAAAVTVVAFGIRHVVTLALCAGIVALTLLPWLQEHRAAAQAVIAAVPPMLIWSGDWLVRRRRPHTSLSQRWVGSFFTAVGIAFAALLLCWSVAFAQGRKPAGRADAPRASHARAGAPDPSRAISQIRLRCAFMRAFAQPGARA